MNTEQAISSNPDLQARIDETPNMAVTASACDMVAELNAAVPDSLGSRLRAAREARGMRCEEAAHKLKLPLATVQALEADCYARIGEGIYLRGYLTKYLQLLELPRVLAERAFSAQEALPPLTTSGTVSRPRYLFQRYSVSALYLILTGVIIVPAVLLATRGRFEPTLAQITPLDSPDSVAPSAAMDSGGASEKITATALSAAAPTQTAISDETPLIASLTPFPASKHDVSDSSDSVRTDADKTSTMPPSTGVHQLRLSLTEPSWVEIVAGDGEKLEFGMLPAGAVRSYRSDKSIDVRLGNTTGAKVEVDGNAQDLGSFRHANVAHFKLATGDNAISHSGG